VVTKRLLAAIFIFGCTPPADDAVSPQTELQLDPQGPEVVLRERVLFDAPERSTFALQFPEPFSHSARRWHGYPMTLYRTAEIGARLVTTDAALQGEATLWLFGPAGADGRWPQPRTVTVDAQGVASMAHDKLSTGRYLFVVGPRNAAGFPARYPSDTAIGKWSDTGASEPLYFMRSGDGWSAWRGDQRLRVIEPLPGNAADEDPKPGAHFVFDGVSATWTLEAWSPSTWFVRDDGSDRVGDVGNLRVDLGLLDIDRLVNGQALPESEDRYVLLRAFGLDANVPAMLRVIPETLDGRRIEAKPGGDCPAGELCFEPRYADDGTAVPLPLVSANVRGFKPTFYDAGEASSYQLEVMCEKGCTPPPAQLLSRTKYPVYYAHGFNSSKLAWSDLLARHVSAVPGMAHYHGAESVDPFRPVALRAEQLRRNLRALIARIEAEEGIVAGERMVRINVVAHSMGGLDTRFLIGSPMYNQNCATSSCTDENGNPESCCAPPDIDGNSTRWSERIVSLTTLSTPHCGSSFADLGVSVLANQTVHQGFELVARRFFGMDAAGRELLKQTLYALSKDFCATQMAPQFPVPDPTRNYAWQCAEGQTCELPPPKATPTIFSWAGISSVSGSVGDIVDPGLAPSYLYVSHEEGDNDGVVAVKSAQFGIFMGVMPHDHFDWTRTEYESTSEQLAGRLAGWLFGVRKEPAERFHLEWLDRLRRAGY